MSIAQFWIFYSLPFCFIGTARPGQLNTGWYPEGFLFRGSSKKWIKGAEVYLSIATVWSVLRSELHQNDNGRGDEKNGDFQMVL